MNQVRVEFIGSSFAGQHTRPRHTRRAGLNWGLSLGDAARPVQLFFLRCVLVAGLDGAMSVGIKILFVQALPAALAIVAILLRR